jgi:hypothetical protein
MQMLGTIPGVICGIVLGACLYAIVLVIVDRHFLIGQLRFVLGLVHKST